MSKSALMRIFFAIAIPEESKKQLEEYIQTLKRSAKTKGIRWTRTENLHITLQFLPEVKKEHLSTLISNVRQEMVQMGNIPAISFSRLQLFPSPFRPRVIVLEMLPQRELKLLSERIGKGIMTANYPIESRPFKGHLTLGRIKYSHGIDLNFLADSNVPEIKKIMLTEVVLFQSEPEAQGSKYTVLERINLSSSEMANLKTI